jgi:hypothetical protein
VDSSLVANSLPFDANAGDYLPLIRKFNGVNGAPAYAYWTKFPFRLRLPASSPDSWQRALETVIARWGQYVPVKMALPKEEVNAEIVWVNNLPKGLLAVTRYTIKDGRYAVGSIFCAPLIIHQRFQSAICLLSLREKWDTHLVC